MCLALWANQPSDWARDRKIQRGRKARKFRAGRVLSQYPHCFGDKSFGAHVITRKNAVFVSIGASNLIHAKIEAFFGYLW